MIRARVRKSRRDGLWIAELPILAGGALVGWYSERFDRQEFAFTFASRGPVVRGEVEGSDDGRD